MLYLWKLKILTIPEWIAINGMSYELWLMSVHDYVSRQTVVAVVLCQQVS